MPSYPLEPPGREDLFLPGVKPYTSTVYTVVKTGIDRFTADAALELFQEGVGG